MGVPKFYRWLSERYPLINQIISDGSMLPDIDNFYLDMNGIIHSCSHPNNEDVSKSLSTREIMLALFRYVDRVVSVIVKPKKLLFIAVDGVAPRAKLNQQRARRFRAGKERIENILKAQQRGEAIDEAGMFDSNCITPGTEFMELVDLHLRWFIQKKVKEDPLWRDIEIIYSGHNVPGEGEHKIMQHIRTAKLSPDYQPNQRHCLLGQDADLIMLGLATHEPHFTLLREVIQFSRRNYTGVRDTVLKQTAEANFQLLHLSVLREYLEADFFVGHIGSPVDRERLVDDFIFLTFLVGNDFLPHLPTLDIGENAFDVIFEAYKALQNKSVGYIVENGELKNLTRLEELFTIIGQQEIGILQAREAEAKAFNAKRRKRREEVVSLEEEEEEEEMLQAAFEQALKVAMSETKKPVNNETKDEGKTEGKDYRGRYYYEKFKLTHLDASPVLETLALEYLKGLMWCVSYYLKGCVSWGWYYPYHYGPLLTDMTRLSKLSSSVKFELGQPFLPFQQLLGCLPPTSKALVPACYQWLMSNSASPLIMYYPLDFEVDMDGKKNPWEAVVLLSFIDADRLLQAEKEYCPKSQLKESEIRRNSFSDLTRYRYDTNFNITVPACNPSAGFTEIRNCQCSITTIVRDLSPSLPFLPCLVPGTTVPIAGFPSLGVIPILNVVIEPVKINVFGMESRYKSLLMTLTPRDFDPNVIDSSLLLGRSVYVNYPQMHEAKVVEVSTEKSTFKLDKGTIKEIKHDQFMKQEWRKSAAEDEVNHRKGFKIPGTGGLNIGPVQIRLGVNVLQGMERDFTTGARRKVYGSTVYYYPIQIAVWSAPVIDSRFVEADELTVEELLPYGCDVIVIRGDNIGSLGKVVGPHKKQNELAQRESLMKSSKKSKTSARIVDVELKTNIEDVYFGYRINFMYQDVYFSPRDACRQLDLAPSVLGVVVGNIVLDSSIDLGLNLKKNGKYQLLGYARIGEAAPSTKKKATAWVGEDTVKMLTGGEAESAESDEEEYGGWEYSSLAIKLIADYRLQFPNLFARLEEIGYSKRYSSKDIFGNGPEAVSEVESVLLWLKKQPFFNMPRSPLSSKAMSSIAVAEIEKYLSNVQSNGGQIVLMNNVPVGNVFNPLNYSRHDVALTFNDNQIPTLGDRVVNLVAPAVPFGLKGTIIAIHPSSKYVEVLFDEEFTGGKSLQGFCSNFRGALVAWSSIIKISSDANFRPPKKNIKQANTEYLQQQLKKNVVKPPAQQQMQHPNRPNPNNNNSAKSKLLYNAVVKGNNDSSHASNAGRAAPVDHVKLRKESNNHNQNINASHRQHHSQYKPDSNSNNGGAVVVGKAPPGMGGFRILKKSGPAADAPSQQANDASQSNESKDINIMQKLQKARESMKKSYADKTEPVDVKVPPKVTQLNELEAVNTKVEFVAAPLSLPSSSEEEKKKEDGRKKIDALRAKMAKGKKNGEENSKEETVPIPSPVSAPAQVNIKEDAPQNGIDIIQKLTATKAAVAKESEKSKPAPVPVDVRTLQQQSIPPHPAFNAEDGSWKSAPKGLVPTKVLMRNTKK